MNLVDGLFYEAIMGNGNGGGGGDDGGGGSVSTIELTVVNSIPSGVSFCGIPTLGYNDQIYTSLTVIGNQTKTYNIPNFGGGIVVNVADFANSIAVSGGQPYSYTFSAPLIDGGYNYSITEPVMLSFTEMV